MRLVSMLAALVLLVPPPSSAQPKQPRVGRERPQKPALVRLLDAGKPPLRELRYHPTTGSTQALTVITGGSWKVTASGTAAAQTWPEMRHPLKLTVGQTRPDEARYDFAAGRVDIAQQPGAALALDKGALTTLEAVEGLTGHVLVTARGLITELEVRPAPGDALAGQGQMQARSWYAGLMVKGMLRQVTVPLPAEKVGVGARWTAEEPAMRGLVQIIQTTTYELVAAQGDQLTLKVRYGGTPDPAQGYPMTEMDDKVSGGGTARLDLARLWPLEREESVAIAARFGGQTRPLVEHAGQVVIRLTTP
ncbi:MAG: hypothetical protein ACYC8T_18400 [Myxococcaceae bacterium]